MTPDERYRRIDAVLGEALERQGPARAAFLDEACGGDADLRREVEALLASHDGAGAFLDAPALEVSARALAHEAGAPLVGRTLGPYPILSLLGIGGMGEVYRASDPRLGREVAIKVLPAHLTTDRDSLARFERETRAIAALSHPNILAIHDVGFDHGIAYAVMELAEGETLRQRLTAGRMPWRIAVRVAIQISDGLAAAHAKGIVHRDLKPANVVLGASNQVKILDFGLARFLPGAAPAQAAVGGRTEPGLVMGTYGYMSPEQASGQDAGPASDIFALGCLVYEMVSGRRPFANGSATESLAAVLRDEPAPIAEADADVPPALDALIRHCLEKRVADRFRSASDLSFALRMIVGDHPSSQRVGLARERRAHGRGWNLALAVVVLAGGVAAGIGGAWLWVRSAMTPAPVVRLSLPFGEGLDLAPNDSPAAGSSLAISPDGQWIALVVRRAGERVIALRGLDRSEITILPGTDGALAPTFSPDSRWIAYFTETDLRKVPVAGGTPTVLGREPPVTRGGKWADDD
jgi:serine/threonine-protein kinase